MQRSETIDWLKSHKTGSGNIATEQLYNALYDLFQRKQYFTPGRLWFNMRDWKQIKIATDWTMYFLDDDTEVWLVEHKCNGTVAYDNNPHVCSLCKTELPPHLMGAMLIYLKRDLICV